MKRIGPLILSAAVVMAVTALSIDGTHNGTMAQDGTRLEVTVHGTTIRWWGSAPGIAVSAELRGPDGTKATATSRGYWPNVLVFGGAGPEADIRILPGDTVIVRPEGSEAVEISVPPLTADADAAGDLIAGEALPGAMVQVVYGEDDPLGLVRAASDGAFSLDVRTTRDLTAGDSGLVRTSITGGISFVTWWEVLSVQVWLSSGRVEMRTSLGSSVQLEATTPGGRSWFVFHAPSDIRLLRCDNCPVMVPGTSIVVSKVSGVRGMSQVWTEVVPDLAVRLDREQNAVRGRGPAGAALLVRASLYSDARRGQWTLSEAVVPSDTGQFELGLVGAIIAPGWLAEVHFDPTIALTLIQQDVVRAYRVALFGDGVEAVLGPRRAVTMTLTTADGSVKGRGVQTSSMNGDLSFSFGDYWGSQTQGMRIDPGDILTIDEDAVGDPTVIRVPYVTVLTDIGSDTVRGVAPPSYAVDVGVGQGAIQVRASRDADHYAADLSGILNIGVGIGGPVAFRDHAGGVEFLTAWVAPHIDLSLGRVGTSLNQFDAKVAGEGPPGRDVRVVWMAGDGTLLRETTVRVDPTGPRDAGTPSRWTIYLRDSSGVGQEVMPGDQLVIDVGDDRLEIVAPELTIAADVGRDTVVGRTVPHAQVTLGVRHPLRGGEVSGLKAIADGTGHFSCDLAGAFDLLHRDMLAASVTLASGHTVYRDGAAPGLLLDIGRGYVEGVALPDAELEVRLAAANVPYLTVRSHSGVDGAFLIDLRYQGGQIVIPRAEDRITVRSVLAADEDVLALTVPELSFQIDVSNQTVIGRAAPGGHLHIQALGTAYPRAGIDGIGVAGSMTPDIAPDGSWQVRGVEFLRDPVTIRPGHEVLASYLLDDGNIVQLRKHAFMANAEIGGASVCGVGQRGSAVVADLLGPTGAAIASARGEVDRDDRFRLVLRDRLNEPAVTIPGQVIRVNTGGSTEQLVLPESSLHVDWESSLTGRGSPVARVSGTGPVHAGLYVLAPANDCFAGTEMYDSSWLYSEENGPDPEFSTVVAYQGPGRGIQTAFYLPSGHRIYRQAIRAKARVYVNTDRISGRASPLESVKLTLATVTGIERTSAVAEADDAGYFDLNLLDGQGVPVIVVAGDRLRIEAGGEISTIPVKPLTFDFGGLSGLIGVTEPAAILDLSLGLVDGSTRRFERQAAGDGRFRFGPDDVPSREGWALGDVRYVELVLPVAGGHEVVAEAEIDGARPAPVLLPFALVPRRP